MNGRGEVGSPDPLDSFPRLRVRESDNASRRSSFGGDDSELERYCSANSVMGTPSTAMSMCSAITVFHDFSDCDFGFASGFDDGNNNSLVSFRGGTAETNRNDRKKLGTQRNLRYGSSGLELYGDGGDELAITALDSSELIGFNRIEEPHGNGNESEVGEREMEREEEDEDFSEVQGVDKLVSFGLCMDNVSCPETFSISKVSEEDLDLPPEEAPLKSLNTDGGSEEKGNPCINSDEAIATSDAQCVNPELDNSKFNFDHFCDSRVDQTSSNPSIHVGNIDAKSFESLEQIMPPSNSGMRKTLESSSTSTNVLEKSPVVSMIEDFELNEFYDEVVQEMEEILLDSVDSPGARLSMNNRVLEPQLSMPLRDGGLTASTSSSHDAYLLVQRPKRINRIEVIGARQKKGDVSFSERLVGVKEYTVYRIKVWSGKDQWEVERRYRDFLTLYRCMKTLFNEQGWILPLPWSSVERESKIFRSASPDIIVNRSVLIQECLQSILSTRFFSSPPRALVWFLSPQDSHPISPVSSAPVSHSSFTRGENNRNFSTLGKTISLIVEIPSNKSMRQLLEAQHHTCAGCRKNFDDGKTLIWDFVQTFGWGKPRLCEYTGQLFCSSCHTNETAVLPARVLHHWDFTPYPVSQMAKSYLDSIHEQPMLCVTAVNPFLLSKVPALLHVMSVRKKIGTMLPYLRCPFRRSVNRGLGSRRYLLESNDFFALRDLIDLSKGVFAALPVMVETVSRKILEHITDQCLICCDVGVPCSARQDCSDPSSLIFPFQEDDIERCKACHLVFHKRCFTKLANCPCGAQLRLNETRSLTKASQKGGGETRGALDLLGRGLSSGMSPRFLSGFFTKEKPERNRENKGENIILMGSLPSTSL
ncbi:PX domain superfamily [Sesbania bispinosa]|nr:PX domain superfamily [Sesbania bispinosa]